MMRFDCLTIVAVVLLNSAISLGTPIRHLCNDRWGETAKDWIFPSILKEKDVLRCPELAGATAYGIFIGVNLLEQKCEDNTLMQSFEPKFVRCRFPYGSEVFPKGIYPVTVSTKNGKLCVSSAGFHDEMGEEELRLNTLRKLCGQCIDKQLKEVAKSSC